MIRSEKRTVVSKYGIQKEKNYFKNLVNEQKYVKDSNFRNLKCEFQKSDYEKIYVRNWRNSVI